MITSPDHSLTTRIADRNCLWYSSTITHDPAQQTLPMHMFMRPQSMCFIGTTNSFSSSGTRFSHLYVKRSELGAYSKTWPDRSNGQVIRPDSSQHILTLSAHIQKERIHTLENSSLQFEGADAIGHRQPGKYRRIMVAKRHLPRQSRPHDPLGHRDGPLSPTLSLYRQCYIRMACGLTVGILV